MVWALILRDLPPDGAMHCSVKPQVYVRDNSV